MSGGERRALHVGRRLAAAVAGLAAVLALAVAPAPASQRVNESFWVVAQYEGSFEGSWRRSQPESWNGGYQCKGQESSGTFRSTIRPGSKPYALNLYKEGRHLEIGYVGAGNYFGAAQTTVTATGWRSDFDFTTRACKHVPYTLNTGCGTRRFAGGVHIDGLESLLPKSAKRVFLDWQLEPYNRAVCDTSHMGEPGPPGVETRVTLNLEKLYRCMYNKPGCRLTIRGAKSYATDTTPANSDGTRYTGSSRVKWSVTFVRKTGR